MCMDQVEEEDYDKAARLKKRIARLEGGEDKPSASSVGSSNASSPECAHLGNDI